MCNVYIVKNVHVRCASVCRKSELDHILYFALHCAGLKCASTNTFTCGGILLRVIMWVLCSAECAFQRKLNKSYFLPAPHVFLSLSLFYSLTLFVIITFLFTFFALYEYEQNGKIFGSTEPRHLFWKRKEGFSLSHLWTTVDVSALLCDVESLLYAQFFAFWLFGSPNSSSMNANRICEKTISTGNLERERKRMRVKNRMYFLPLSLLFS